MMYTLYFMYCVIVAILYTRYYIKTHQYQIDYGNLENKKFQLIIVVFLISLLIAPFIMVASLYDKITY